MFYLKSLAITVGALMAWVFLVGLGLELGWYSPPLAPTGDTPAFMTGAIQLLEERQPANVAMVLMKGGEVFDDYYRSSVGAKIDGDTLFPVASMSKWITAYGVLALAEQGRLDPDQPVAGYLRRWQLPPAEFDPAGVTVHRLLRHRAGFTDGLGFGDYLPEEPLPDLVASLSNPRTSSGERVVIGIGREPGSAFEYSGGGYHLLELVVEDITGQTFEQYVQATVFEPLGMSRSTYEPIGNLNNIAGSYTAESEPAPLYRYASSAATALATSANDLSQFLKAHIAGAHGNPVLSQTTVRAMAQPQSYLWGQPFWGTGVMVGPPTGEDSYIFGHDGGNDPAINAAARLNPDNGDGIIVLVSGDPDLATELASRWAHWQSGRQDVFGILLQIPKLIPFVVGGCLLIFVAMALTMWRRR